MDLQTITMEQPEAQKAFEEYREAVRAGGSEEDAQIMRGYRELARGSRLITLTDTIVAGGLDDQGLPRLAVMRADVRWCWVRRRENGAVAFTPAPDPHPLLKKGVYRFPADTFPAVDWKDARRAIKLGAEWWATLRAMVPPIPPALRPPYKLGNYAILWEATWEKVPRPPGDPALLRHIGGDLYAVLAVWDLTDLERAVLAGRRPE